jgi:hypothetical protein
MTTKKTQSMYIYIYVCKWSDREARWWELRVVVVSPIMMLGYGLLLSSFRLVFSFLYYPEKKKRRERIGRKNWQYDLFALFFICLSSLLFSSGTVNLSYKGCKWTNAHKRHLFILRPVFLWEKKEKICYLFPIYKLKKKRTFFSLKIDKNCPLFRSVIA